MYKKAFQSNANRSLADRCPGYIAKKSGGDGVAQCIKCEKGGGIKMIKWHHGSGHMGTPVNRQNDKYD